MRAFPRAFVVILVAGISAPAAFTDDLRAAPARITKIVDAYPDLSPDGSQIVFQSNRSGNMELYTVRPDGTGTRQLTRTEYDEGTPVWSPDGKLILFAAEMAPGNEEVLLMNADGSSVRRLTDHPASDGHAHWSPDGKRIIFNSSRSTPDLTAPWNRQWHEIFTMNLDGTDLRQITRCQSICTFGVMASDGKHIAYRKIVNTPGFNWDLTMGARNSEVFVARADGSGEVNVSNSAGFDGWPAWSPDGQWLLFSSNRNGRPLKGDLFVVKADGSSLRQISESTESLVQASWSKDGRKIFAAQYTLDEEASSIAVMPVPDSPPAMRAE